MSQFTKTERHNLTYEYKRKKEGRKRKENMTIPFSHVYHSLPQFQERNNHLLVGHTEYSGHDVS